MTESSMMAKAPPKKNVGNLLNHIAKIDSQKASSAQLPGDMLSDL